ncbi:MAG TPA: hypothetical protein VN700_20140 [Vicinamibacterales bacterium]|nr:hypothetical protein [Vicinamibacterales bacterium]
MNILWQMPAVVLAVLAWLSSPTTGLVDIAQREAFRRAAMPKAQASLSNLGLPSDAVPSSAVSMPPSEVKPAGDPAAKPADAAAVPEKPEKKDPPREESWWRNKMNELRAAAEKDQLSADALQSRINALKTDSVNIDDPIKQTKARMDLVKAMDEFDKTKKQVEADNRAVAALQEDARRFNIPPGWIR